MSLFEIWVHYLRFEFSSSLMIRVYLQDQPGPICHSKVPIFSRRVTSRAPVLVTFGRVPVRHQAWWQGRLKHITGLVPVRRQAWWQGRLKHITGLVPVRHQAWWQGRLKHITGLVPVHRQAWWQGRLKHITGLVPVRHQAWWQGRLKHITGLTHGTSQWLPA